ncbi:hypothetical protein [Actinomadura rubteroloni]|uniref:hypothetical protein n=1 Tax=Actinomadura rubteroloni TaxID=1926885 RepID=UPI0011B07317|nr:hypothetical protein [Actinomadura rubteroloni]
MAGAVSEPGRPGGSGEPGGPEPVRPPESGGAGRRAEPERLAIPGPDADRPAADGDPAPGGAHARPAEPAALSGGLSAAPPRRARPKPWAADLVPRPREPRHAAAEPARRRAHVDAFVAEFVGGATWQATLAVLEGAFPGLGIASELSGRTDDLWRSIDALDLVGGAALGVPAWSDASGMVFDLSAHRAPGEALSGDRAAVRSRASRPYAGAFVIDTLDPLRYHRAMGGPQAPGGKASPGRTAGEEDDTGVVIVADLTAAGDRILDAPALWRHAGRVVTATLLPGPTDPDLPPGADRARGFSRPDDPAFPDDPSGTDVRRAENRDRVRNALRALRRVVLVDPGLGLGVCLEVDATRTPRCLLAFGIDPVRAATPRFVRL